jgi:hypothetical protein
MTQEQIANQIKGTRFLSDLETPLNINGVESCRGYYNLIVSIRDVSLFTKGLKPDRTWRLKDVKTYFGVKGGSAKVLEQLHAYKEAIFVIA